MRRRYLLIVPFMFAILATAWLVSLPEDDSCNAPCTVKFPSNMEEDEFRIDYVNQNGKKVLKVWREKPTNR